MFYFIVSVLCFTPVTSDLVYYILHLVILQTLLSKATYNWGMLYYEIADRLYSKSKSSLG